MNLIEKSEQDLKDLIRDGVTGGKLLQCFDQHLHTLSSLKDLRELLGSWEWQHNWWSFQPSFFLV